MHNAGGAGAVVRWPIALSGALGYLYTGWGEQGLPWGSAGYVYLPAMLVLMVMTVLLAPIGARAAHRLPVAKLKKAFALLMVVMATQMLWTLLR